MQQGFLSQSGMVSIFADFPYSPDMVSEIKVASSSYAPEYGGSTSAQIVAVTKSGTDEFHGAVFEYFRHHSLNATPWGVEEKPENEQHNFGANFGGPLKIPGLWSDSVKTYFYVDVEGFRQEGSLTRPTISIPSLKQRNGDFTDWVDAPGNLIPSTTPPPPACFPTAPSSATSSWVAMAARPTSSARPVRPRGPGVAAVPPGSHERGSSQQLHGRSDTEHPSRRQQLLLRTLRHGTSAWQTTCLSPSGTSAPRRDSTPFCPGAGLGGFHEPAERVGQPAQLGPHLQPQPPEPRILWIPEPQ